MKISKISIYLLAVTFFYALLNTFSAYYVKITIEERDFSNLWILSSLVISSDLIQYFFNILRGKLYRQELSKTLNSINTALCMSDNFISQGKITSVVQSDAETISGFKSELWRTAIPAAVSTSLIVAYLVHFHSLISAIIFILFFPLFLVSILARKTISHLNMVRQMHLDSFCSEASVVMKNKNIIKAEGYQQAFVESLSYRYRQFVKSSIKQSLLQLGLYSLSFNYSVPPLMIFAVGIRSGWIQGGVSEFFEFTWLIHFMGNFMVGVPTTVHKYFEKIVSEQRVQSILNKSSFSEVRPASGHHITSNNVISKLPVIFKGNNIEIRNCADGTVKRSLVEAILKERSLSRRPPGLCVDVSKTFPGTITENITGSTEKKVRKKQLVNALKMTVLSKDLNIKSLRIAGHGQENSGLSTGQCARLGVARLIYQNRSVNYAFDVLQHLDQKTRRHMLTGLNKNSGQKFVFIESGDTL